MSRAFVKENDDNGVLDDLPPRPVSPHPNYVTPAGARMLHDKLRQLQALHKQLSGSDALDDRQSLKAVERDLRYFDARASSALVVNPAAGPLDHVHFGSVVEVEDHTGQLTSFTIVGEDEADVAAGKISWISPLAQALLDSQVDDTVVWKRPAGERELSVVSIRNADELN